MNAIILELCEKLEAKMIETRRYLHVNPEVSSHEYETSKYLKAAVRQLGLEPIEVPNSTGFYAVLDTGKPGKTLGIRTDIDALPMQEATHNLKQRRDVISSVPNVMHACGHDGHMATVLGAIEALVSLKDLVSGRVIFIFEEGEEIGAGIDAMVAALEPIGLDAVYGTHLTAFMDTGTLSMDAGPVMGGSTTIALDVVGRGGHGSRPDLSVNPVFAAANILTGITSAWANQIDVTKTITLGITQFHAGTTYNVIPDSAFLSGSLRYFDYEAMEHALDVFKHVARTTALAHRCEAVFQEGTRITTLPVINDIELSKIALNGAKELFGDGVKEGVTWFASESFAGYRTLAPSLFVFVGIRNQDIGSGAEHHNQYFDLDEKALRISLANTLKFALTYLQ